MPEEEYYIQYKEISEVLLEYGWIIAPSMIGGDFYKILALTTKIKADHEATADQKQLYRKELEQLLTDIVFHPLFRAFNVYKAKELNHVKKFSHHLERAMLHYYKFDYFSTVLCLLPAVEGVLLSYYGWEYGKGRKPKISALIDEIEKCRMSTYDPRSYKLYAEALGTFLKNWIFSDTSSSDTTFSYLNRHYVLHGMGVNNYYSLADAHRLIMFFDLFIEFLSIEQRLKYAFIPEKNELINIRRDYYLRLIEKNIRRDEILAKEDSLVRQNSHYYPESKLPSWPDMILRAAREHIRFMKDLDEKYGRKNSGF